MTTQERQTEPEAPFDGIREVPGGKPPAYFNILFYGLIIWGICFSAYYLLSGWSSDSEFQAKMASHQESVSRSLQPGAGK